MTKYCIQILDASTNNILYFSRIKSYHGVMRIITSEDIIKKYDCIELAKLDMSLIEKYYKGDYLIDIVEL